MNKEVIGFQAEVTQLLDIMIHSLYSNKEIFLRELISNASDAIDRLRFALLADPTLIEHDPDYKIRVSYDSAARTITVSDNGIGMTRSEVIEHIGTIAKSGTREFFQSLTGNQQKDVQLIGQFGVGFYSAFVVADKVTLTSRRAGLPTGEGVLWESDGKGQYSLETIEKTTRGTDVVLHLREGEDEFLSGSRLRSIIRKYSDHISLPVVMPSEEKEQEGQEEVVNRASALWTRSKSEISEEEYKEFYTHVAHDFEEPLAYVHSRMEGAYEYILLLYVPKRAPFDLWSLEQQHGVKLYVRRVFILDDAEKLMPRYLRFIRGVIDSSDLPLNISREMLQQNRVINHIRSNAVKKVIGLLTDMAENDKDKYTTFWNAFGRVLKEGITEDSANRETLATLLRFASTQTATEAQESSLDDYIGRMKDDQNDIYYVTAESFAAASGSPLLEIFRKKGLEVLLFSDPVDTILVSELNSYKGKTLHSIARGTIDLSKFEDEQEREEQKRSADEIQDVLNRLKDVLSERVKEVRVTNRLTSSPACLVVDEYDIDPTLQRLLKASGRSLPASKPILEVNPQHQLILKLKDEQDTQRFTDFAFVLFDQSVLSLGEQLEDPISFVKRLNTLLTQF